MSDETAVQLAALTERIESFQRENKRDHETMRGKVSEIGVKLDSVAKTVGKNAAARDAMIENIKDHEMRVRSLETYRARAVGVLTAVVPAFGVVGAWLKDKIFS